MKKGNYHLKKEIERVEALTVKYRFQFRTGVYRNKFFIFTELLRKVKMEIAKVEPDEIYIGILYKELKACN